MRVDKFIQKTYKAWTKRRDERFYQRWEKVRDDKYWLNALREGVRGLVFMLLVVLLTQYIVNDRVPPEIIRELSADELLLVLAILFLFSALIGIIAPYEYEKRYKRHEYQVRKDEVLR